MNQRQKEAIDYGIWNVSRYADPVQPTVASWVADRVILVAGYALTFGPFIALAKGFFQ